MTTEKKEIELAVPQPLAQALVNYLQQRPFAEVHELIGALMQCRPVVLPTVNTNGGSPIVGSRPGSPETVLDEE